jgi:PadR family transcriptional regulator, regulatory protein PadR
MAKDDLISERNRKTTAMLILTVLESGPKHGYGIIRKIEELTDGEIILGEATVYPALRVLERDGFVQGQWEHPETGMPRKTYAITKTGLAELAHRTPLIERFANALLAIFGDREHGRGR